MLAEPVVTGLQDTIASAQRASDSEIASAGGWTYQENSGITGRRANPGPAILSAGLTKAQDSDSKHFDSTARPQLITGLIRKWTGSPEKLVRPRC